MKSSIVRFFLAAALIVTTAILLRARTQGEVFPPRLTLQSFPHEIGEWTGNDMTIDTDTLQVLGPGDFLLRVYSDPEQHLPYIDLFIAYFPSQSANDTMHSPKNCLQFRHNLANKGKKALLSGIGAFTGQQRRRYAHQRLLPF